MPSLQPGNQPIDRAGGDEGVVVQEQDEVTVRAADPRVVAGREADVRRQLNQPRPREPCDRIGAAVGRRIVDDHGFGRCTKRVFLDRPQARREMFAAVEVHDDDRQPGRHVRTIPSIAASVRLAASSHEYRASTDALVTS